MKYYTDDLSNLNVYTGYRIKMTRHDGICWTRGIEKTREERDEGVVKNGMTEGTRRNMCNPYE